MITMFAGDPILGKSYVSLAMAAAVSRGLPLDPAKDPSFPPAVEVPSASSLKNSASAAHAEFPVRDAHNQVPDGE
jgi:hypothetical protein